MILRKAQSSDLPAVLNIYESVRGQSGCVWNEYYPTKSDIDYDFLHGGLYVLASGGNIIGAVSVIYENELDDLDCWEISDGTQREIARVCIAREYQGNSYSSIMLSYLYDLLSKDGCRAVHLLAAKHNAAALKIYRNSGYTFLGECNRYNHDYFICEKIIQK